MLFCFNTALLKKFSECFLEFIFVRVLSFTWKRSHVLYFKIEFGWFSGRKRSKIKLCWQNSVKTDVSCGLFVVEFWLVSTVWRNFWSCRVHSVFNIKLKSLEDIRLSWRFWSWNYPLFVRNKIFLNLLFFFCNFSINSFIKSHFFFNLIVLKSIINCFNIFVWCFHCVKILFFQFIILLLLFYNLFLSLLEHFEFFQLIFIHMSLIYVFSFLLSNLSLFYSIEHWRVLL